MKNLKQFPLHENDDNSLIGDLRDLGFQDLKGYLIQYVTESYYGWFVYIAKDEQSAVDMITWEPHYSGETWSGGPVSPIWSNNKAELKKTSPKTILECMRFAIRKDMVSFFSVYTDIPVNKKITSPHWATFSGFDPYETIKTFSVYFDGDISSIIGKDSDFEEHFDEGQWNQKNNKK